MKRILSIICAVALLLSVMAVGGISVASVSALSENGYTYTVKDGEATVTGYTGSDTELVIPSTLGGYPVRAIGEDAFYYSNSIQSIVIPDGITVIEAEAFMNCTSLQRITLPDSVTSIGDDAFYKTAYYNTKSNWINDVLYIDNHLIRANISLSGAYTVRPDVISIGCAAFRNCTSLQRITLPDSVTSIGMQMFYWCTSLESIDLPDSVISIGDSAFYRCESLESVTLPDSLTSIGDSAFYDCRLLKSIALPDGVTRIDAGAFAYCNSLSSLTVNDSNMAYYSSGNCVIETVSQTLIAGCNNSTIPDGVTNIGDDAFRGCQLLQSIIIPDSVTSIGDDAFYGCELLQSIAIPDGVTKIGDDAFGGCQLLQSIVIPDSVTSIGDGAFYGCESLQSIAIPDGVASIGDWAFQSCTSLTSVVIPDSMTSIGNGAFDGCELLESIDLPDSVNYIGSSAFYGCDSLKSIVIPSGVTEIQWGTFSCLSLEEVTLPSSVTTIGTAAFVAPIRVVCYDGTSRDEIAIYSGNEDLWNAAWCYGKGLEQNQEYMYTVHSDKTVQLAVCFRDNADLVIPQYIDGYAVTSIGINAFSNNNTLTSVTFSDGVTAIGDGAFYNCESLQNVTLPDSVMAIGDDAFKNCTSLHSITLPNGVTAIGSAAFYNCKSLERVKLPDSVISIGGSAFEGCTRLTSIILPYRVKEISGCLFWGCSRLTSVAIPDAVSSIGYCAFWGCNALDTVCYVGTEAAWQDVFVDEGNDPLLRATFRYAHTVSYNANGGVGAPSSQIKIPGTPLTLSSTVPTREGYAFLGWATNKNATQAAYQPGDAFKNNTDTTLYAVWQKTHTVFYNANGGVGAPSSQIKIPGTPLTLSATVPTREGYAFLGWATNKSATQAAYQPGDAFKNNTDTTLYAVWQANAVDEPVVPDDLETPPMGDLSGDGRLDMRDAFALYVATSGGSVLTEEQMVVADMNGDGKFDMRDAFALYKIASGG